MKRLGVAFLLLLNGAVFGADKMVLGYYPSWTSVPHSVIPWQYLTHIAHAFIGPKADGSLEVPSGLLYPALITAAHAHEVKVVVSVGGWNETYASNFSTLAADSATRRAFASNLTQFCVANGYDGADVDWEFPANTTDRANHAQMIHAIRQAFDSVQPGLTLSMAGSSGNWYGQWIDFAATKNDFDWIGIMTYDFYGDWMSVSGPNSPLNSTNPPNDQGCVALSVGYYNVTRGVPKEKLLTGVPFYGWTFNSASLYGPATGSPRAIQEVYSVIAPRLAQGWTRTWDATGQVPYMQDAAHTKLTSYDDSTSVALKAEYVVSSGVAGAMVWALGQDRIEGKPVLLEVLGKALRPVTSVTDERAVPEKSGLEQNYPNPFNPRTVINSQLSVASDVKLVVYDLLGREVTVLVNEKREAGSYQDTFDASGHASGMYLYRLTAGAFTQARTMMLVK